MAMDGSGDVWIPGDGGTVDEFSATGSYLPGSNGNVVGGIDEPFNRAMDGTGNSGIANRNGSVSNLTHFGTAAAGSPFTGGGLVLANVIAIDGSGSPWIANTTTNTSRLILHGGKS